MQQSQIEALSGYKPRWLRARFASAVLSMGADRTLSRRTWTTAKATFWACTMSRSVSSDYGRSSCLRSRRGGTNPAQAKTGPRQANRISLRFLAASNVRKHPAGRSGSCADYGGNHSPRTVRSDPGENRLAAVVAWCRIGQNGRTKIRWPKGAGGAYVPSSADCGRRIARKRNAGRLSCRNAGQQLFGARIRLPPASDPPKIEARNGKA